MARVPLLLVMLALSAAAPAQTLGYWAFKPWVLDAAQPPAQMLFTAELSGSLTRAEFVLDPGQSGQGAVLAMRDDGQGGDEKAGDGIYSVRLDTAPVLAALRPEDANRAFVGYMDVYNGSTRSFRYNLIVDVLTPDIPRPLIRQLAPGVQATERLVNIVYPAYFQGSQLTENMTQEFYRSFRDDYDFLNLIYLPARALNRFHANVKNEVQGIGLSQFNASAAHGSGGRLLGVSHFPIPSSFDGAEQGYLHELGHQWVDFLNLPPFAQGRPHWPFSSMGTGIMGISIPGPVPQGGNFSCDIQEQNGQILLKPRVGPPGYNDLDLYLMGLIRADEVRTQFVFDDQLAAQHLGCVGQVYSGSMTRVSAQTIVQQLGARVPGVAQAQVQFRIGSVLITRDGPASAETMWLYSAMAERAELRQVVPMRAGLIRTQGQPFALATRGLAALDTRLVPKDGLSIEGLAHGPLSARQLSVKFRPEPKDVGTQRQLFVAALVGGTQWYFRSGSAWSPWTGGAMPVFASQPLSAEFSFNVLDGSLDLRSMAGTEIFAGYGVDAAEMLAAGRYARVHRL